VNDESNPFARRNFIKASAVSGVSLFFGSNAVAAAQDTGDPAAVLIAAPSAIPSAAAHAIHENILRARVSILFVCFHGSPQELGSSRIQTTPNAERPTSNTRRSILERPGDLRRVQWTLDVGR